MIVLSKKKLMLVMSMVCISLISCMFMDAVNPKETVETVNLPVSNKVIVLDARSSVFQMKEPKAAMVLQKRKLI